MGEEEVSSEEAMDLELREAENENGKKKGDGAAAAASVVRWERFLPRMVLRVLLVEADDSTRQIIAALLRKCSFRVAAVSDGLKAWELLKGKPHNVDLILTEVDLPSISGFALLTLIMEHEICKSIPVIMMSSNDSVSTVYKCMLRGAADFLVKPVRKNELRNLWQHVWRRQASTSGGNGPQDDSVAQQKVEATAENNAASNQSSGFMACIQRNRECIEKGSDAQSSCTKPDLEAERENTETAQNLRTNDCEDRGLVVAACDDANAMTQGEDEATGSERAHANIISEACHNNHVLVNSSREAIDLIGALDNNQNCGYQNSVSYNGINKVDSLPLLDLSLRRSPPNGSVNQVGDGRHTLNHSDASAFSRYINKALQPPHSSVPICHQQRDCGANSDRQISNHTPHYNPDPHALSLSSQKNMLSLAPSQYGQAEGAFPSLPRTVFPVPVPLTGIRFESNGSLSTAYGNVVPPIFCTQTEHKQSHKLESSEDRRYFSSANDQSASSSFCNGYVDQGGVPNHDKNCHRSVQREAALNKFRLKRKDRCYEKKVRYESRKKLAEQRPRVKGQFVRHLQAEQAFVETDGLCGNSLDS